AYLLPLVRARGLLLITGVTCVCTAVARQVLLRETRPATAGSEHFQFTHVFSGRLAVVLLISVAYYLVLSTSMWGPFLALHASDAMGLSKSQINLFYAAGSAVSALSSLLAGRAVARWGVYRVFSWATLGLGGSVLLWALQRHPATRSGWSPSPRLSVVGRWEPSVRRAAWQPPWPCPWRATCARGWNWRRSSWRVPRQPSCSWPCGSW
ncbi:MAG: hypothetical protein H5T71_02630, partial [Chloroflexi bacterium]|nr:hypothetical protein [Chloroflexota bacterium]